MEEGEEGSKEDVTNGARGRRMSMVEVSNGIFGISQIGGWFLSLVHIISTFPIHKILKLLVVQTRGCNVVHFILFILFISDHDGIRVTDGLSKKDWLIGFDMKDVNN